jgi:hypothetical protein
VEDHVPFSKVDSEAFRRLMLISNPSIKPSLCSRQALRRWIKRDLGIAKEQVKFRLLQALSKVHISFDIWTAPSFTYSFLGVVAHCVVTTEEGPQNQAVMLALRRIADKHDGEKISKILLSIIEDYNIIDRLGVFMADNEVANNVAVARVLMALFPGITDKQIKARRARCLAHIINLAAQAFLFGSDTSAFESQATDGDEEENFDTDTMRMKQEAWRKTGALGKLHNVVSYIFSSSGRRDAWRNVSVGNRQLNKLWPVRDNSTRWNSHYNSVLRALKLKDRLNLFIDHHRADLSKDALSPDDWQELQDISEALRGFEECTLDLQGHAKQGHHGSLWEWLPTMEALLSDLEHHIEVACAAGNRENHITVARQNAYQKLQKYYEMTDQAYTLYAAATLLSPEQRGHYFDEHWTTAYMQTCKREMRKQIKAHWSANYRDDTTNTDERPAKKPTLLSRYLNRDDTVKGDAFDAFTNAPRQVFADRDTTCLLQWWELHGSQQMKAMAYDYLAIPCTSCEVERAFSSAKNTMTPQRARLGEDTVEDVELLRHWWRQGIISSNYSMPYDDDEASDGNGDDEHSDSEHGDSNSGIQ